MFKSKIIESGKIIYSDMLPELEHFFTTRDSVIRSSEAGVDIEKNIEGVCQYLNILRENLVSPIQTHSTNISYAKYGVNDYPETDGLILDNYEQTIYLNFADCTPIILYDAKQNIGAVVHAGWRGTVGRIVINAIDKLTNLSGSKLNDIYAVIGPAIGQCCYKVGDEVIDGIKSSVSDYTGLILNDEFVDLKLTNLRQMTEFGVNIDRIDVCPICTSCRNDLFFSYRKENGTTSRHSAVIKLNKK